MGLVVRPDHQIRTAAPPARFRPPGKGERRDKPAVAGLLAALVRPYEAARPRRVTRPTSEPGPHTAGGEALVGGCGAGSAASRRTALRAHRPIAATCVVSGCTSSYPAARRPGGFALRWSSLLRRARHRRAPGACGEIGR